MKPSSPLITFHFVPFPQEIWDDNIELSLAEFRLLGYLLRYYVRWGQSKRIRFTDDELLYGRKEDGIRIDSGCGISSANSLKDARKKLEEKGWITYTEDHSDKARPKRYYAVNSSLFGENEQENSPVNSRVSVFDTQLSKTDTQLSNFDSEVSESDTQLSKTDTRSDSKSLSVKVFSKRREEKLAFESDSKATRSKKITPIIEALNDADLLVTADDLVEMYNREVPSTCPQVERLSPARRGRYDKYIAMYPSKAFWMKVFEEMAYSDFLRGYCVGQTGSPFKPDLDWLCQKGQAKPGETPLENCEKVHKGKYRDAKGHALAEEWSKADPTWFLNPSPGHVRPFVSASGPNAHILMGMVATPEQYVNR